MGSLTLFPQFPRALSGQQPEMINTVVSCSALLILNGSADYGSTSSLQEDVQGMTSLLAEPPTAAGMQVRGGRLHGLLRVCA